MDSSEDGEGPGGDEEGTTSGGGATTASTGVASSEGSGSSESSGSEPLPDVPDNAYCMPTNAWPEDRVQREVELLEFVNAHRMAGATCPGYEPSPPTHPLMWDPSLRCAARAHSLDMDARAFFDHISPDGASWIERIAMAGGSFGTTGENIATGQTTPAEAVEWWMQSPPHCRNIMDPAYDAIGIGYYPGGEWGHLWTQTFGG